jgi:hypothetical protein
MQDTALQFAEKVRKTDSSRAEQFAEELGKADPSPAKAGSG